VLQGYWQNVLLPAIQTVWGFVQEHVMPLLGALGDLLGTVLTIQLQNLANAWNQVLKPALDALWKFVQDKIIPTLKFLHEKVIAPLVRILLDGLGKALDWITRLLSNLNEELREVSIPAALGGKGGFSLGGGKPITGAARGANFMVPPGFPDDTFLMGLTSGEHVMVANKDQQRRGLNVPAVAGIAGGGSANLTFVYSPAIGLGTAFEAERILKPFLQRELRQALGRTA
jgi:hypothetical protein